MITSGMAFTAGILIGICLGILAVALIEYYWNRNGE